MAEDDGATLLEDLLQQLESLTPRLAVGLKLATAQRLEHIALAFKFADPGGEVGHARRSKGEKYRKNRVTLTHAGQIFIESVRDTMSTTGAGRETASPAAAA